MNNVTQYLTGYGIRPSVQRIAIMRYLQTHKTHPTADEIFDSLRGQIPTLSKTTVYNTLKLFVDQGAAIHIGIDEKNSRFDGQKLPHAHLKCKECGKIFDMDVKINNYLPENFKGKIDEIYFYMKGACEMCAVK